MSKRHLFIAFFGLSIFYFIGRTHGTPNDESAVVATASANALNLYSVAKSWPGSTFGNHRAQLTLDATKAEFAWARVEWRLPGLPMEERRSMLLADAATGEPVRAMMVLSASWEACELVFEPTEGSRTYLLYFLPFDNRPCQTGPASSCTSQYRDQPYHHNFRAKGFKAKVRPLLDQPNWRESLPRAIVSAFEARTSRDSFFPMEVAATTAETQIVHSYSVNSNRNLLVWVEDREHPIRMNDKLPLRWLARGVANANTSKHEGASQRGEFYAFQLGVHAPRQAIHVLPVWTALDGPYGHTLGKWRLRSINTPNGSAQATSGVRVPLGGVQAFWFGIEVPEDAQPGTYRGAIHLKELHPAAASTSSSSALAEPGSSAALSVESVAIALTVSHEMAVDHGDNDLWRHARLRWLDSDAGSGAVVAGAASIGAHRARSDVWRPINMDASTLSLTASGNRVVRLSRRGLPHSLSVGSVELLASRMLLKLFVGQGTELRWQPSGPPNLQHDGSGGVSWTTVGSIPSSESAADGACKLLVITVTGTLHTDGMMQLGLTLSLPDSAAPSSSCSLSDVHLVLPLKESATRLINGFGWKGATRPNEVSFRWDDPVDHAQRGLNCRVWLGGPDAGMQLNLQGVEQSQAASSSHCGNDDSGVLRCDDLTDAQFNVALGSQVWYNQNRGGASVKVQQAAVSGGRRFQSDASSASSEKVAMLTVYTGTLKVMSGSPVTLPARILLTPVRGAGEPRLADFATRYFHMQRYTTVDDATSAAPGAWIILHQGNQLNPYINYPFLTINKLRDYVQEAHSKGAKVKLYYTVRELSASAAEFWALRSLGGEVIIPSKAEGGHAWLKEHVRSNYSASWHERLADGEVDVSVHTPAFTTRWDNYWLEGILWLVKHLDIDGIYLDGAPYERAVLRRLRAALEPLTVNRKHPFLLDLHASCAGNPHLPYTELYPFIDSIWYGEQCNYAAYSPEQWLAEVSGVPFGLPGQVLGDNADQWQALVFGMTCRIYPDPHRCNPRPLWAALDAYGLQSPRMLGWWDDGSSTPCPVRVSAVHGGSINDVRASLFIGSTGTFAIAVANWASHDVSVSFAYDWQALARLGLSGASSPNAKAKLVAVSIPGFQPSGAWRADEKPVVRGKRSRFNEGWLLKLEVE